MNVTSLILFIVNVKDQCQENFTNNSGDVSICTLLSVPLVNYGFNLK